MEEKTTLKIAVVRPYFTVRKGGAERYSVELANVLADRGHTVHIFAFEWDQPEKEKLVYHRVGTIRKPAWLRVLVFHWNLRRCLGATDYDVIFGMTPFTPQVVFRLGDGLYRFWTRVMWPVPPIRWFMCLRRAVMLVNLWLERRIMEGGADHMIANSELVKRQAMTHYNVPENRISVVYPGVDLKRFNDGIRQLWRNSVRRELGLADDETVLLFVANNFKRKGLHLVFRALAKISKQNRKVRLLVVGGGRVPLYSLFARLMGIEDRVLFVGWTSAMEHYYSAADVFVLPTNYDPFAAVCLEAMSCGLPVVTTRMNGASEMIVDGENGFVVGPPKLQDELTERIRRLLNVDRRAVMGALAKQQAAVFSFKGHFRHIESVLVRIARHRRAQQSQTVRPSPDLVINQAFLPLLRRHRLATYTCLMGAQEATQVKIIERKQIFLLSLQEQGKTLSLYLKRHQSRFSLLDRYRRWVNREIRTEGMAEWSNIHAFHARGLPTVTPVAAGERLLPDRGKESFVLTLGLSDYVPLDRYIRMQFMPPMTKARLKEKRVLVRAVANLTRELHWAGFNHRDYYLCHLYIKRGDSGEVDLRIIDLQRVDFRTRFRRRWLIKDLGALHYSSLATPLTDWDRLRFHAIYSSGQRDQRLWHTMLRRILKKSESISRHDARRLAGRDPRKVFGDRPVPSSRPRKSSSRYDRSASA